MATLSALVLGVGCVPSDFGDRHASLVEGYLRTPGTPADAPFVQPDRALGPPDGRTVALGRGSFVVVRFFRPIPDGPGSDLRVYELGDDGAQARVGVSEDGDRYVEMTSVVEGPVVELDLAETGLERARLVRVRGLDDAGAEPGFDLDALEALH